MGRTLLGRTCRLYRNTAVTDAGLPDEAEAEWNELDLVKDAKYSISGQTSDTTVRRHERVKREETVLDEVSVEFDIRVPRDKLSSADYVALRNAKMSHAPIEFALCNRPISTAGTEVFRVVCEITSLSEEQPLGDAVKISVTAKATDSDLPPRFTTSTGNETITYDGEED